MFEPAVPRSARNPDHSGASNAANRFEATFHHAPVGIAHLAPNGRFLDVNAQFANITGHSREALIAHGFAMITHPEDLDSDLANVGRLLAGHATRYSLEKRYLQPDGSIVWVNLTVRLIRDATGAPDYFISVIEDRTEVMQARADALRDPLTGLLNRRGFDQRLTRERARAETGEVMTLVYLDLDGFKLVNDVLGHAVGDRGLIAVARAIEGAGCPGDRCARLGGDEFAILMPRLAEAKRGTVLARFRSAIEAVEIAPDWTVRGRMGAVTLSPRDPRPNDVLIALAYHAMFEEKRRRQPRR